MVDDLWPARAEHFIHAHPVADVGHNGTNGASDTRIAAHFPKLCIDSKEVVFAQFNQHEFRRPAVENLAAEFRADRAAVPARLRRLRTSGAGAR